MVSPRTQAWWAAFNILPLPGVGAAWLGYRNPHTRLLRNGILQATLVVLGSFPLVIPGVIGLLWAIFDAWRIAKARLVPLPTQGLRPPGPTP